jgi:Skp family chaperone for outer membrane proteins
MRARLVLLAGLLAGSCGVGEALAQQPPAAAATAGLSVMVVDVQTLAQNSKAAKMVRQQIEGKRAEYQKELTQQENDLRKESEALQKQQGTLTPEAFKSKGRELQGKVNQYERDLQSKRQALERSNADALKQIDEVVKKVIYDIAKDRKVNLVLQRGELLLYDPAFDVTDQVLQKLDEQLPTLTVTFVAPVAVTAPEHEQPTQAGAPKTPPPKKK